VLGEPEWKGSALEAGAGRVVVAEGGPEQLATAAAQAFLGRDVDPAALGGLALPGRLERRDGEIRDGAHNPAGIRWLAERLPPDDYTVMASILADKDVDAMLDGLAGLGGRFVACGSSSPRALPAAELAARARGRFEVVEQCDDPREALALAHSLGEPVLVTGSLYLLADLEAAG
jgi:dihydrofolate synthase/folylpolyglutamate synthase